MPYDYIDHQADVGLLATGPDLASALRDAVLGLLNLLVELETVEGHEVVPVTVSAEDPAALLVALLNAVLAEKDIRGMFFRDFQVRAVGQAGERWFATGDLLGEPIDLSRHQVDTDVKAATWGGVSARQDERGWTLRCILDL